MTSPPFSPPGKMPPNIAGYTEGLIGSQGEGLE